MRARRKGIAAALAASAVVIVILVAALGFVAYDYYSSPLVSTSTVTVVPPTVTRVSTVTPAAAPLITYSADAYATEATALLNGFSASTGVPVAPVKSGGSNADATAIAAGAPDDVFISSALSATSSQFLGNLTANWAVGFATDQMVVAYSNSTTQTSAAGNIISLGKTAMQSNATSDWNNFYTSLVSGGVKVGISSPVQDPGGLRAWLVLEAAGYMYSAGNQQAYVSILLKDNGNVTAASAALLVAPLQAGNIQFLFTYKSAAVTAGLNYLTLDSHVNLGAAALGSFYSKFSYTDSAGVTKGAPIVIAVTIPLGAVNTSEALQFVQYVVQNAKSVTTFGLVPLTPCLLYENTPPPVAIQHLATQGQIAYSGPLP